MTKVIAWSPRQDAALKAVRDWLKNDAPAQQVFRLFGYAGTGKTTLATHLAEDVQRETLFASFTGKAALVMRSKGCKGASTIHSLIYSPEIDEDGLPSFTLNDDSDVKDAALVIVDECSMVGPELGKDLLSFGIPVLVLGDPAQLPPVKGAGFFTEAVPDVLLTEIHRQAAESPIIRLATDVREGRALTYGEYGSSRVIRRGQVNQSMVMEADQVLVGLNRTRHTYNSRIRTIKGHRSALPVKGDKLVCLKNKHPIGLLNGGLWSVKEIVRQDSQAVSMKLDPEGDGVNEQAVKVTVPNLFFEGREAEIDPLMRRECEEFTYGYALTCHKAQGSQWDKVMVFDESGAFRDDARRWRYTAITRAAESVTIAI